MDALFLSALDRSLSASWVIAAVVLLRLVLKKAPRWLHCALWALVAVRLVCPFSFESTMSLMPNAEFPSQEILDAAYFEPGEILSVQSSPAKALDPESSAPKQTFSTEPQKREGSAAGVIATEVVKDANHWLGIGSTLWAAGMAGMFLYAAVSYLRLRKRVAASIELGNGVYLCDYIASPFILGIVKPKIYLPSEMEPKDAAHVLSHERAHLKRKDHWWKPFGFTLLTVYWFNPAMWLAYVLLCRDIELACDERVVKVMGLRDKKEYSEALLKCSVPRRMVAACPLAFGEVGVKERVKSVLRYKKPAFWVVVIAVVVCLVAGVCFLTDPVTHTLDKLRPLETDQIQSVYMFSDKGTGSISRQKDIEAVLDILKQIEYDPKPVPGEEVDPDWALLTDWASNSWGFRSLEFRCEDREIKFYLSDDNRYVWIVDEDGTTEPYSITNGSLLKDYMNAHTVEAKNLTFPQEPFATADQPSKWLQQIGREDVQSVTFTQAESSSSYNGYRVSAECFRELVEILNAIPPETVTGGACLENYSGSNMLLDFLGRRSSDEPSGYRTCLSITDGTNNLSVYLRLLGDRLELVILDGTDWITDIGQKRTLSRIQIWGIQDSDLLFFMQELCAYPTWAHGFVGTDYEFLDEEPLVISHGNAHICTEMLAGWVYEIVPYAESAESFGIRCRPEGVDEGWIYFSFWPGGYDPVEEDRYYIEGYCNGYREISCYPASANTANGFDSTKTICYYTKTEYPTGDYAIITDGADGWYSEYRDVIGDVKLFTSFHYGTYHRNGAIRTYGNVTVDFSLLPEEEDFYNYALVYFDWDTILAETGATELKLLAPKWDGEELFLVGQYGESYCFLCFHKTDNGYRFRTLLSGGEVQHEITEEGTQIWYADYRWVDFEEDDDRKRLLLVLDETVTAIQCTTGYGDYQRLDSFPALLVLDKEDWGSIRDYGYTFRYDEPPTICYNSNLGLGPLVFTEAAAESGEIFYLYDGLVEFYDGVHLPGGYGLEPEDLETLRDILVDLPQDSITKCTEPEEKALYVDLQLYADNGLGFSEKEVRFGLSYNKTDVTITMLTGSSGNWTKHYFRVTDPELNAFMETLCDDSRRDFNVAAMDQPETVSYSHGDGSILLDNRLGWEFEIVEYTDEETPFGIRCRPVEYDEGWVFFSYWPGGFTRPKDAEIHKDIHLRSGNYVFETGYYAAEDSESEKLWMYQKARNVPGDYVILNEGANQWLDQDGIYVYSLIRTDSFAGGTIVPEEEFVYPQGDDPREGPNNCVFGTNDANKGYLEIDPGWMSSIWKNDAIPYFHLFRFWPEWETEGFISFSFIEGGFTPEDGLIVEEISLSEPIRPFPGYTATAEGGAHWQYLWIDVEGGSYVFRNDGADHWTNQQWQEVMAMINSIVIAQYDVPQ